MKPALEIPEGYVLVPKQWADEYFIRQKWQSIEVPTIKEVAEYLFIGTDKIKKDLTKIDCPLRKAKDGGKGRGQQMKFFKQSVEHYKDWLTAK